MTTTPVCAKCGAALPADAPRGICPQCLLNIGLESTVAGARGAMDGGQSASFDPPREGPGAGALLRYFGDYELLSEIARGGMGVVYKARQVKLNRIVAVKMILGGQLASETDIQRFLTEAEAAANLQHPHIVAIHEVGEHEGRHYFSMDYVEGQNLADYAKAHPLPAARAAQLVKTIAEAIHFAHQRGTLHRDLKPQNVLIDAAGQPRITDFGLAKLTRTDSALTREGAVMGSPSYMSPEQAAGKNEQVGPSSDVYSIGAMLYHLLTGRTPFVGETPLATLRKVMEEEPDAPSKLNPKVPPDLETICLKCLEKRTERRYHSARELAEELGRFLNHEPILARPATAWRKAWSWARRNPWIITAAASALVLSLIGFAYSLSQENAYLHWARSHPNVQPSYAPAWFETDLIFILLFVAAPFLPILPWIDFMVRRRRGDPILRHHLAAYSALGASQVATAIFFLMKHIEATAWHLPSPYENFGVPIGAFYLMALGLLLLWESVREHFSAVSSLVAPEPRGAELRARSIFGEILGGLGVSPGEWRTGPLAILFLGGPIWLLAAPVPFLPQEGVWITIAALAKALPATLAICAAAQRAGRVFWITAFVALAAIALYPDPERESRWLVRNGIWFPLMLTATELPIVLAFCATVKGAARFFWIFGVVPIAAISTIRDFGSVRSFSFEGWVLATAAGLVLLHVAKRPPQSNSHSAEGPESGDALRPPKVQERSSGQGALGLLKFPAAWACLGVFFVLMVPEFPATFQPRPWFSLLVAIAALPATSWCLSRQRLHSSTVILLVLILLFAAWIIFASPYAISFAHPSLKP